MEYVNLWVPAAKCECQLVNGVKQLLGARLVVLVIMAFGRKATQKLAPLVFWAYIF